MRNQLTLTNSYLKLGNMTCVVVMLEWTSRFK